MLNVIISGILVEDRYIFRWFVPSFFFFYIVMSRCAIKSFTESPERPASLKSSLKFLQTVTSQMSVRLKCINQTLLNKSLLVYDTRPGELKMIYYSTITYLLILILYTTEIY